MAHPVSKKNRKIFETPESHAELDKNLENNRRHNNLLKILKYSADFRVSKTNLARHEIYRIIQLPRTRSAGDDARHDFQGNLKIVAQSRILVNSL